VTQIREVITDGEKIAIGIEFVVTCSSTDSFREQARAHIFAHTSRTYATRRRLQSALRLPQRVRWRASKGLQCASRVAETKSTVPVRNSEAPFPLHMSKIFMPANRFHVGLAIFREMTPWKSTSHLN
jgi:hypothetical protein